jgi:nitrate reductase gamma subunit
MDSVSWPQIITYIAFLFVIIAYGVKISRYFRMPIHLRWELYPVPHEKGREYGGSYFEDLDWWTKPRSKSVFKDVTDILKRYLFFGEYYRKTRGYWLGLYPWHIGFYLLMGFQGLALLSAILMATTGLAISSTSGVGGEILYYLMLVVAIVSFVVGIIGSIGLLIKRLTDQDLKAYASPENYFNYLFFLVVFLSLLFAWVYDPTLSAYRDFWVSLITAGSASLPVATYVFIVIFALHVIHLPFTRSTHYITKILAFFWVRWDDKPNLRGSKIERKLEKLLGQPVTWSAAHIQSGSTWGEIVKGMPEDNKERQ